MAARTRLVLLASALLVVGFGVMNADAGRRHAHKTVVKHYVDDVVLPPSNDAATGGVQGVGVRCPRGYTATGGGFTSSTIATVPHADLSPKTYQAVAINETTTAGRLEVTVACIRARTTATRAQAEPSLRSVVERYRSQRP
jgi:hypothetical protein